MKFHYSLEIDAPVGIVFSQIHDRRTNKLWIPGVPCSTFELDAATECVLGTRFRRSVSERGRARVYEGEITAIERPHHLGVKLFNEQVTLEIDYRVRPLILRSSLEYSATLTYSNRIEAVIARAFGPFTRALVEQEINKLKDLSEAAYAKRAAQGGHGATTQEPFGAGSTAGASFADDGGLTRPTGSVAVD